MAGNREGSFSKYKVNAKLVAVDVTPEETKTDLNENHQGNFLKSSIGGRKQPTSFQLGAGLCVQQPTQMKWGQKLTFDVHIQLKNGGSGHSRSKKPTLQTTHPNSIEIWDVERAGTCRI